MKRWAVAAALVAVAIAVALFYVARRRPSSAAAGSSSSTDSANESASAHARARLRTATPLRLPAATTSEDATATAGEFGGRVVSSDGGKPIAHAALTFLHGGTALSAESDDDGRFHVTAVSPGAYELTAAAARGFVPFAPLYGHSPVTVWARARVKLDDVTVYLTPATKLTVVVQDEKGKPLAAAEVRAFEERRGAADARLFVTDDKGEVTVEEQPLEVVEARRAGYVSARAFVGLVALESGRLVLRLAAGGDRPRLAISGRVVDATGQPVDGALVEADAQVPFDKAPLPGAQTLCQADGGFTLAQLDDGVYTLRAQSRGKAGVVKREVRAGSRDVELRLGAATATLRGNVRDASGKPVIAFSVVARLREGLLGRGPEERATVIDSQGHYELPLAPGKYEIAAAARGFARTPWQNVELGDEGATIDFVLRGGSRVFGRVVERGSARPLGGAHVVQEGDAVGDGITLASEVVSTADGSFAVEGLAPGRHSLSVQAAHHDGRILSGIAVPSEGEVGPLTIDLKPTAPGEEPKTELTGIAAQLSATAEGMRINGVIPGGGAAEAGLEAGDVILAVDGQRVENSGFVDGIQLIRGPEDTIVILTVRRKDGSVQEIPVRRKRINM
ncbi:MAG: signal protein [Myxococcales bacterium]|nr:signal protein [Myxococcales bacterium]